MTVREAARKLEISSSLVYALCSANRIRHERHGLGRGKIVIPENALEEYRKECVRQGGVMSALPLRHITLT